MPDSSAFAFGSAVAFPFVSFGQQLAGCLLPGIFKSYKSSTLVHASAWFGIVSGLWDINDEIQGVKFFEIVWCFGNFSVLSLPGNAECSITAETIALGIYYNEIVLDTLCQANLCSVFMVGFSKGVAVSNSLTVLGHLPGGIFGKAIRRDLDNVGLAVVWINDRFRSWYRNRSSGWISGGRNRSIGWIFGGCGRIWVGTNTECFG